MGLLGQGLGFRVQGSGFRVQGSGFRVQGSGFRVQGSGLQSSRARSDARNTARGKNKVKRLSSTTPSAADCTLYEVDDTTAADLDLLESPALCRFPGIVWERKRAES